ncbi:MAG TPA: serine/threonine-protein kinase [Tepidisphaeraceae bacterium]|jgi:serine/threonine-protein kinase|nr:serine/threonine-protein kinase [Tepidisphaeraceae bacterium]
MPQKLLHYEVLEHVGEGARSTIYLVQDPTTRQKFALKHVVRDDQKDIRFIEQMEQEFEISRQFNHPNLRKSYELKVNRTLLLKVQEAFLVMEWVEGRPLDARLPQDMIELVDAFIQAAQGLRAMHQLGYVHCDIKPNNILRSDSGVVKVIDFGQSCKIGTVKERIQGTPDFIAPEQVDRKPVTIQTDVFNLGATLYWAICGKHIPTLYTVKKKGEHSFLLDARIDTPQQLNPKIPVAVSNLIMDCVATLPRKRPADMDALINRLELGKHILQKERGIIKPSGIELNDDTHHGTEPPGTGEAGKSKPDGEK